MNRKINENEVKDLKSALMGMDFVELDEQGRDSLKKRVMNHISLEAPAIQLDRGMVAKMKENVLEKIENHSQKRFFWSNFFAFHKRLVASALVLMLTFSFLSFINVAMPVVYADSFTVLTNVQGEVKVWRGGRDVVAENGMELFEKDRVETGAASYATIQFFDDTVTRLSESTALRVERLSKPARVSEKGYVEIAVDDGEVWSYVLDFQDASSDFVVETEDLQLATTKGSFDLKVDEEAVQVGVFSDVVELRSGSEFHTVESGKRAVVNREQKNVQVRIIEDVEHEIAWVKDNLNNDQKHLLEVEERLLVAKMESVGLAIGEDFSFENSLREETVLFLTFDDVKKEKMALDLAERNFVAAQIKLGDPILSEQEREEALKVIDNFASEVESFYAFVEDVASTDQKYAEELDQYVQNKLVNQKRSLSIARPEGQDLGRALAVVKGLGERDIVEQASEEVAVDVAEEVVVDKEVIKKAGEVVVEKPREEVEGDKADSLVVDLEQPARVVVEQPMEVGNVELESGVEADSLIEEPDLKEEFGVEVEGDKALDPLLR